MGRKTGRKSEKVHKITEAEYAEYIMSLKDETPPLAYRKYEKEDLGAKKEEREKTTSE